MLGDDLIDARDPLLSRMIEVSRDASATVIALMEVEPRRSTSTAAPRSRATDEDDVVRITRSRREADREEAPSQPRRHRPLRAQARDLRRARDHPAGQGRRDPADRRARGRSPRTRRSPVPCSASSSAAAATTPATGSTTSSRASCSPSTVKTSAPNSGRGSSSSRPRWPDGVRFVAGSGPPKPPGHDLRHRARDRVHGLETVSSRTPGTVTEMPRSSDGSAHHDDGPLIATPDDPEARNGLSRRGRLLAARDRRRGSSGAPRDSRVRSIPDGLLGGSRVSREWSASGSTRQRLHPEKLWAQAPPCEREPHEALRHRLRVPRRRPRGGHGVDRPRRRRHRRRRAQGRRARRRAIAPFFEPGLQEMLTEGVASGRLRFTTDMADGRRRRRALRRRRHTAAEGRLRRRPDVRQRGRRRAPPLPPPGRHRRRQVDRAGRHRGAIWPPRVAADRRDPGVEPGVPPRRLGGKDTIDPDRLVAGVPSPARRRRGRAGRRYPARGLPPRRRRRTHRSSSPTTRPPSW